MNYRKKWKSGNEKWKLLRWDAKYYMLCHSLISWYLMYKHLPVHLTKKLSLIYFIIYFRCNAYMKCHSLMCCFIKNIITWHAQRVRSGFQKIIIVAQKYDELSPLQLCALMHAMSSWFNVISKTASFAHYTAVSPILKMPHHTFLI